MSAVKWAYRGVDDLALAPAGKTLLQDDSETIEEIRDKCGDRVKTLRGAVIIAVDDAHLVHEGGFARLANAYREYVRASRGGGE